MKKLNAILIIILTNLLISSLTFSQDLIFKKNGDEIKAKVIEVGATEIKYKKFENINGPNYTILKSEVFIVKYENGSKDIFNEISKDIEEQQPPIVVEQPSSSVQSEQIPIRDKTFRRYATPAITISLNANINMNGREYVLYQDYFNYDNPYQYNCYFDPTVKSGSPIYIDKFDPEFKIGLRIFPVWEFGFGYTGFSTNRVKIEFEGNKSATYLINGSYYKTFYENYNLRYYARYSTSILYTKFYLPLIMKEKENVWKNYYFDFYFMYSAVFNRSTFSHLDFYEPVFPNSFTGSSPNVSYDIIEFDFELKPRLKNYMSHNLSLGFSFTIYRYFMAYVGYTLSIAENSNKDIDFNLYNPYTGAQSYIEFPGTINTISMLKIGLEFQLPVKKLKNYSKN